MIHHKLSHRAAFYMLTGINIFSSSGQSPERAIVLALVLASAATALALAKSLMLKFFV